MARKRSTATAPDDGGDDQDPPDRPGPKITRTSDVRGSAPPGPPFLDIRPPKPQPPRQFTPIFEPKPSGWQVYYQGRWVDKPGFPPRKMVGYFEYRGYWLHYDPDGTGPGAARYGIYLGGGFYAGHDEPPKDLPPVGWDLPPID